MSHHHPGGFRRLERPVRLLLSIPILFICSCERGDSRESGQGRLLPSVEAVQARHGALPLSHRFSGVVTARNQVDVHPEISAVITEVLVEDGATVRRGEPLVRLQDSEFRQRLVQARANHKIVLAQLKQSEVRMREASRDLERLLPLGETELASRAELETAQARVESAGADVELAQARVEQSMAAIEELEGDLAKTVVEAPLDGRVGNRNAEVGMLAGSGTRLFTLGQMDSVRVEIVLTDRMLAYIEEGQRAEVSTGGSTTSSPLARISPFLNPVTHSTEAGIDLANPDGRFKPGMFVSVDVFYGETEEATLVPLSALYEHPATGVMGVYVTRESLEREPVDDPGTPRSTPLTDPVSFEFVPAEVLAQGRMEAAVGGVERGEWVVSLGQNLLGGETAEARVRPVEWERVQRLQQLQREDLMQEVIERLSVQ
jgi:RND family efflux transporter MFP subunit